MAASLAVEFRRILIDVARNVGACADQRGQVPLVNLLVASPFLDRLRRDIVTGRNMAESREQRLELEQNRIFGPQPRLQALQAMAQDARIFARIDGKAMLVIEDAELALLRIEAQLQFAVLQRGAVMVAQHRQQHRARNIWSMDTSRYQNSRRTSKPDRSPAHPATRRCRPP